jgi:endonuclease/exonuclease/phosphatase family metal-dependent hydrolase
MRSTHSWLLCLLLLAYTNICAQSICIDGKFTDWNTITKTSVSDAAGDATGIDLISLSVTNDEENLYLRIETKDSFNISDSNNIYINIDADNNSSTGFYSNGIGSELGWRLGYKYGFYYHGIGLKDTVFASQLKIVGLPTYKSNVFEIAINRNSIVGSGVTLFSGNIIKINLVNGITGGDYMPDKNSTFTYTFNNTLKSDFKPIDLSKCNANFIRLMSYNVFVDGLTDSTRIHSFERIFKAINADIIVLNECSNTTYQQVKTLLDSWMPLAAPGGWNCYKVDGGNVVCSRFPILHAENISFRKATFTYIDLPAIYQTNLIVIGTHLYPDNDGDSIRQREADVIAGYIRNMKAGTTTYPVPSNTPFLIAGDFNMVNSYSPLNTLLTGNIVNTADYGTGTPPDWNNLPISSIDAIGCDRDMTYSWRNQSATAKWWPGKLDYILHSNTNLKIRKSFVLQTENMSVSRLTQYGLQQNDNLIASDHLPIVTDIQIPLSNQLFYSLEWNGSVNTAWENPANWNCSMVPDENSDVVIPAGVPNFPVINLNTEIHSIHLNYGSNISVKPGIQFKINGQ